VLEAISKLKLKNSKNHFAILAVYLPAYNTYYTVHAYETTLETTCII